jgi:SAM-dependent methyltransferase
LNEDLTDLRHPYSKEPLKVTDSALLASNGDRFPIVSDIPRFVPADNYAADFGRQWNRFPATQLDSRTGIPLSEERLARCFRGELPMVKGARVLEAGSGAGRFTEILLKYGAILDSFDFSNAVEANAANNGGKKFNLVQADIGAMPFAPESYDFVVCLGVLQHTPDTEQSLAALWTMVAPGGRLIIDHYRWNFWKLAPPPLGDAEKLYRRLISALPPSQRYRAVERLVNFWFPIYWAGRKSKLFRKVLNRIAGIHFYYGQIDLRTKARYYEWSLLDTHDGMTDRFKRFRTCEQIRRALKTLKPAELHVWKGGNGVEAWCRKAAA